MPQLDALRALALMAVLSSLVVPAAGAPFGLAYAGASFFFVLSGYLITSILLRSRDVADGEADSRRQYLFSFYGARLLRIVPAYGLVIALALVFDVEPVRQIWHWLLTCTFNFGLAVWGERIDGFFHLWTLSVEVQFYLVWPLFVLFAPRRWLLAAVWALIVAGPLYRAWAVSQGWDTFWVRYPTPASLDALGVGALVAVAGRTPAGLERLDRGLRFIALPLGLAALALLWLLYERDIGAPWQVLFNLALALIFAGLIRSVAQGFGGMAGKLLELRPILYLGTISYGVYVYHQFLPQFVPAVARSLLPGLEIEGFGRLFFVVVGILVIAAPVLSWHILERPILDLKNSLGQRSLPQGAGSAPSRRRGYIAIVVCAAVFLTAGVLEVTAFWEGRTNHDLYDRRAQDEGDGPTGIAYYISPSGDDGNPGTSPDAAWRTLGRVSRTRLGPGDRICLEGGQSFTGCLCFGRNDAGTPARPISVGSYGTGRATILAGDGPGICVRNTMGFRVHDLMVIGCGRDTNRASGIVFENDLAGDIKLPLVHIERVEVRGFGEYGIVVKGNRGKSGFRDVRIVDAEAHDNALAGIYVRGRFLRYATDYANANVYVGFCKAHHNPGIAGPNKENSGSGIVMSNVDGGVIERCVAYENGQLCDSRRGGPVGIWAWDAKDIVIQCNESYRNFAGGSHDGGGFDLDGGVTHSVLQYNYSHDNDGPGYMVCQFCNARRFADNIIRYNVSQDDSRRNDYGAIHVHDDNYDHGVKDCQVYNNTVYAAHSAAGSPSAIFAQELAAANIHVRNNIFQTSGGVPLVTVHAGQNGLTFQGNAYFAGGAAFAICWNETAYPNLRAWREATGQERIGSADVGLEADPQLVAPGRGGTLGDARLLETLGAYRLRETSPLIDAALDLKTQFGLDPGRHDFYGNGLPQRAAFDIGAHEWQPERSSRLRARRHATPISSVR
jgi:peptidoglycan/LPS O-acetylase OafA/YrhL